MTAPRRFLSRVHEIATGADLLRIGVPIVCLAVLAAAGASFWIVIIVPGLIGVAIWLLAPPSAKKRTHTPNRSRHSDHAAYLTCVGYQKDIQRYALLAKEARIAERSRAAGAQLAIILAAIAEDRKYAAAPALLDLSKTTHELLVRYSRVARRGLENAQLDDGVAESLASLVEAYRRFWERLNRDAIVDLVALNELIESGLAGTSTWTRIGGDR